MAYTKKNLLVLLFITAFLMTGCNFSQEVDMEEWIIPYREMVNEINQDNGWTLSIIDEERFYDTYKNYTLSEAKEAIVKSYLESQNEENVVSETRPPSSSDFVESTYYSWDTVNRP